MTTTHLRLVHLAAGPDAWRSPWLQALASHPAVQGVYHRPARATAACLLGAWPANRLPRSELQRWLGPDCKPDATHVLLAPGMYLPGHRWRGAVLLREPRAAFLQCWGRLAERLGLSPEAPALLGLWELHQRPRLLAWCQALAPHEAWRLGVLDDPVSQYLLAYELRLRWLQASRQPVVDTDTAAAQPQATWHALLQAFELPDWPMPAHLPAAAQPQPTGLPGWPLPEALFEHSRRLLATPARRPPWPAAADAGPASPDGGSTSGNGSGNGSQSGHPTSRTG